MLSLVISMLKRKFKFEEATERKKKSFDRHNTQDNLVDIPTKAEGS